MALAEVLKDKLTILTTGLVLIFLALLAYRSVFILSVAFDEAGDTHAI